MLPNFSYGNAMTTYTGQNYGARKLDRLESGSRQGILLSLATSVILTSITLLMGRPLANIFTDTQQLIDYTAKMLRILAAGYIVMGMTQTIQGYLRGIGDTKTPMWISILTNVIMRVPVAYILAKFTANEEFPNGRAEAIFISLVSAWVLGFLMSLAVYIRSKKKLRARVEQEWLPENEGNALPAEEI